MHGRIEAPFRIGVDVGGTFTDAVIVDASGETHVFKSPSNPSDPATGVLTAIELAAAGLGLSLGRLLSECSQFVHGSTIATNTLLERKGARVGLLATKGFRDSLEIRRGLRADVWDHRMPNPEVLVPRYLRVGIPGRLDSQGKERIPLDLDAVCAAVKFFREENVTSLAICFLHSYANPMHERAARDAIAAEWPDVRVSCSADVAPILGEYERSSTAVLDAYVAPRVLPYLDELNAKLKTLGLRSNLLLVQSNGGAIAVGELANSPVQLILSGPAAGVSAIQYYGRDTQNDNLVAIEVGGTSCDVTLSVRGSVSMADRIVVDGYHLAMPAVEINTIGAGGGTLAHVDRSGLLHAGPEGAGARPGPASYGLGGEHPTVTDAQLVLGRLKPGPYAGGAITLDLDRARQAIERHVARPLGLDVQSAAAGILRLVDQGMQHAVERISIERGFDPREFTLIAAGGAGPLHGVSVAASLGSKSVFVPRLAGVFCAFGMCNTDIRHDYQRAWSWNLDASELPEATGRAFDEMENAAREVLQREGFAGSAVAFERRFDLRYVGQQWTVGVGVEALEPATIRRSFETEHRRLYGHAPSDGAIEVVNIHLTAIGRTHAVEIPSRSTSTGGAPIPTESRPVWLDERAGVRPTAVYDGRTLQPGDRLEGPAIVDEATTTVLVGVGQILTVSAANNYLIDLRASRQRGI